jgi:hypothetical protein
MRYCDCCDKFYREGKRKCDVCGKKLVSYPPRGVRRCL